MITMSDEEQKGLTGFFSRFGSAKKQTVSEEEIKDIVADNDELADDEKRMIHDIIEHSQDKPEVAMSPEREEAMHGLRRWMFDHVYHDGIAKAEEGRAQQMIEMLYGYYMAHPEELPEESHRIMEIRNETKERAVCDYIAGMTDIYAIDRFKELFIPKAWSV